MLEFSERAHCLGQDASWTFTKKPIFIELLSKSSSLKVMAEDLCKVENEIYEKAHLKGHAYSLIFGPCEPGIVRVCVIKGLWRKGSKKTISVPS